MIDVRYELDQLEENPEWLDVLETYDRLVAAERKANPESEGWVTRLHEVNGVETEDLSFIHGNLIAHGFLRFQIADRNSGMEYQLSQLGKKAVKRVGDQDVEEFSSTADADQPVIAEIDQAEEAAPVETIVVTDDAVETATTMQDENDPQTVEVADEQPSTISEVENIVADIQLASDTTPDVDAVENAEAKTEAVTEASAVAGEANTDSKTASSNMLPIVQLEDLKKSA